MKIFSLFFPRKGQKKEKIRGIPKYPDPPPPPPVKNNSTPLEEEGEVD
ncbi:MAG: hypothetical protein AB9842_08105 [Bacteroidales bacterium]